MKWIIIEPNVEGHRIEYYNHLYCAAAKRNDEYIFIVDSQFEQRKKDYNWPDAGNIKIEILDEKYTKRAKDKNLILSAFWRTKILYDAIKRHKADHVLLLETQFFLPFLPLIKRLAFPKVSISGIMFRSYPYRWKNGCSTLAIIQDKMKLWLMSKTSCFGKIFMVNDGTTACFLNRKYRTDIYRFLPDPIMKISIENHEDIRAKFNIGKDKILLAQFGGLGKEKGTHILTKGLKLLPDDVANKYVCILAGKVKSDIKDGLLSDIEELKMKMRVILIDEYCSYDFIGNLCEAADYGLMTYTKSAMSSGCLGICAQFHLPVIGTGKDLLGKIIRRNRLGHTLKEVTAENIRDILVDMPKTKVWGFEEYYRINSIENFTGILLEG